MDKELFDLTQLNQISSIDISDLRAKLRSNDKQLQQDIQTVNEQAHHRSNRHTAVALDSNVERGQTAIERGSDLSLPFDPSTGRATEKTNPRFVPAMLSLSAGQFD